MNDPSPTAVEQADEELVAYLDGELDTQAARQLEERLARDAALQRRLQGLQRSWDLLDQLPRAQVDEKFVRTTVEMVALAAEEDVSRQRAERPRQARRRGLVVVATMLVAGFVGYAAYQWLRPDPNAALLRDLPVVENVELYRQIDDIEFLRRLDTERLFAEEDDDAN